MKLLLDQNISHKLVTILSQTFPESSHVYLLGLQEASDIEIWNYARQNNFSIVTQDSDFYERSLLYGYPPKIIWLQTGNTSTKHIASLFTEFRETIYSFNVDENLGCLIISSI